MSYTDSLKSQTTFANAMTASGMQAGGKILNEKGCPVEESTNVPGVDAYHKLVRDETLETKTGKVLAAKRLKMGDSTKKGGIPDMETEAGRNSVIKYVNAMLEDASTRIVSNNDPTELIRTFIMPFLKRRTTRSTASTTEGNVSTPKAQSGGEGEKLLFYQIYLELYKHYPYTMRKMLSLVPEFGCWKDVFAICRLWEWRIKESVPDTPHVCLTFRYAVLHLVWKQLRDDKVEMLKNGDKANISLCAKWIPLEFKTVRDKQGKKQVSRNECMIPITTSYNSMVNYNFYTALALLFYNGYTGYDEEPNNIGMDSCEVGPFNYNKLYTSLKTTKDMGKPRRQLRVTYLSPMKKHLEIVESMMCDGKWSEVKPEKVPSRAQHKYRRAFLDETEEGKRRHEGDKERDTCRENFLKMLLDTTKINTAGVEPHEIIREFMKATSNNATAQKEILRATWNQKVKEVYQAIVDRRKELEEAGVEVPQHLGNLIGMADVSGSMGGQPMEVSIALTLFLAALQEEAGYRPLAISFTDVPRAFDFTGMTLEQRIEKITANVGYRTDFGAAMNLVLDTIKSTGHHMDMVVFTDEQFDTQYTVGPNTKYGAPNLGGSGEWTTFHQQYLKEVAKTGLVHVPRVIYWNLRAHTQGVHTDAKHPGVQMLQGYNLNNLRFVLFADGAGEETEVEIEVEVQNEVTGEITKHKVKTAKVTPYDTYCTAMNDEAFNTIREVLYASQEKLLKLVHNPIEAYHETIREDIAEAIASTTTPKTPEPTDDTEDFTEDLTADDIKAMMKEMKAMRLELEDMRRK